MNVAATFLAAAAVAGLLAALAGALPDYVLKPNLRALGTGLGTALAGAAGVVAGVAAMTGEPYAASVPGLLPLSGVTIELDALAGPFLVAVGVVAVAAGVHAVGDARSRVVQAIVPLFVVAMLLVPAAGGVGTFLACWGLVAVTSLVLVLVEHRDRPDVAVAGRWYAAVSQLGLLTVLCGLLMLAGQVGDDTFAALRDAEPSGMVRSVAFVLTLAGFAAAAGAVPLHVWLPRAHAEAPGQVSALMSAAMVTLGGYGIVRVGLDLLGGGPRWWWLAVLALGVVSAVAGLLRAAVSGDLKRLLARSTIASMGLVLTGIGAAGLFAAAGDRVLAGLALTAALLHVLGHAAYTALLFLAAGSVVRATGTRELESLGGLRRKMPVTTAAFGLGALAASALPPGTAFVSVWLLLQALVHGPPGGATTVGVAVPVALAAVALSAGLAVAALAKAFGVGFLARPRSAAAERAVESPPAVLAGMGLAGLACAILALGPTLVLPALGTASGSVLAAGDPAVSGTITVRLNGFAGTLSPLILTVALAVALAMALGAARLLAGRRTRRVVSTWDGGASPAPRRATTFALPPYLPERTERRLWRPALAALDAWGRAGRLLATGSVHRYLGYGFYAVCGLLALLAVTR